MQMIFFPTIIFSLFLTEMMIENSFKMEEKLTTSFRRFSMFYTSIGEKINTKLMQNLFYDTYSLIYVYFQALKRRKLNSF